MVFDTFEWYKFKERPYFSRAERLEYKYTQKQRDKRKILVNKQKHAVSKNYRKRWKRSQKHSHAMCYAYVMRTICSVCYALLFLRFCMKAACYMFLTKLGINPSCYIC